MNVLQAIRRCRLEKAIDVYWQVASKSPETHFEQPDAFQVDDWLFVEQHTKCCILRARGGSKTHDFTHWLVFRVLRTQEVWTWLTPKSGQLNQAKKYFRKNPFVRRVRNTQSTTFIVELWSGDEILCGIISESNLGARVDGIVFDEFQGLEPKQEAEIASQMRPMMTVSKVHKTVYLGTRWIATKFDDYCDQYPTSVHPWDTIPHLVDAGMIAEDIADPAIPEWEKDLLYRCIRTTPHGLVFPTISPFSDDLTYKAEEVQYGIDFGSSDMCVGVVLRGSDVYVVEEYAFQLEADKTVYDFLDGCSVEVESGGYNDSDKYAAKSKLMHRRIGAKRQPVTNKWKSQRQMKARRYHIHCNEQRTREVFKDLKNCEFDPKTGLYLKDTHHPNHYLDAFLHALHQTHTPKPRVRRVSSNLHQQQQQGSYGKIY